MSAENTDLSALMELADKVLSHTGSAEFVDLLEQYAQAFDVWFRKHGESIQNGKSFWSKAELENLLGKHQQIVDFTGDEQAAIPEEMRKLKLKGKGIMAYTDSLPKKISLTKTKKG